MPGENTKHSPVQAGPVPAMGHQSGSDPAPTSAGNAGASTTSMRLAHLVYRCVVCPNPAGTQPCAPHPGFSQVSRVYDAFSQYDSSAILTNYSNFN